MCNAPILAHPLFGHPFILYMDASAEVFVVVLCQVWEKKDYATAAVSALVGYGWMEELTEKGMEEVESTWESVARSMWKGMSVALLGKGKGVKFEGFRRNRKEEASNLEVAAVIEGMRDFDWD